MSTPEELFAQIEAMSPADRFRFVASALDMGREMPPHLDEIAYKVAQRTVEEWGAARALAAMESRTRASR